MARVITDGREVGLTGAGAGNSAIEGDSILGNVECVGAPTISEVSRLSGRSLKCTGAGQYLAYKSFVPVLARKYFNRFYFMVEGVSAKVEATTILAEVAGTWQIKLSPAGSLRIADKAGNTVGGESAELKPNVWYRAEPMVKKAAEGKGSLALYLAEGDGTATLITESSEAEVGNTALQTLKIGVVSGTLGSNITAIYFDDIAANDETGEVQSSYPGPGHIVIARPKADKANVGFTGGGGATTNLWGAVDNRPPAGVESPGTNETQIGSANNNATDHYEAEVQSLAELGISPSSVKLAQGIARAGNSSVTSRTAGVQVKSNPEIAEATKALGTTKAIAEVTGWTTFRTGYAYAPTMSEGEKPVVRANKKTASTDNMMFDLLGLQIEYTPTPIDTLGVTQTVLNEITVRMQATRLMGVAQSMSITPSVAFASSLASTGNATQLATLKETLHGVIAPRPGAEEWHTWFFSWGLDAKKVGELKEELTAEGSYNSTTAPKVVEKTIEKLEPATVHYYALVVEDSLGKMVGEVKSFVSEGAPTPVTGEATVDGINATVHGAVNPDGYYTTYWFEYGLSEAYGSKTAEIEVGEGKTAKAEAQVLHGLSANSTYHYRIVAKSYTGYTAYGADATFTNGEGLDPARIPGPGLRPYANSSPFNRTLAQDGNPTTDPNSAAYVAKLLEDGKWVSRCVLFAGVAGHETEIGDYLHPIYYSTPSDPLYKVSLIEPWGDQTVGGATLHIPNHAVQAFGGDGHLCIIELDAEGNRLKEWDFWQVGGPEKFDGEGIVPGSPGTITASWGGWIPANGDGRNAPSTAASFGLAAGVIRIDELKAGEIPHALFMAVPHAKGTVYPAVHEGGYEGSEVPVPPTPPLGQRFKLNMSEAEIKALGEKPFAETILIALTKYGAFIGDQTGANGPWTGAESSQPWISAGEFDPLLEFAEEEGFSPTEEGWAAMTFGSKVDWASKLVAVGQPRLSALTEAATGVRSNRATLNGVVNPDELPTTYWFEYGETTSYGSTTPKVEGLEELAAVSAEITGLHPNRTYHFRLVAESAEGEALGEDATFTTEAPNRVAVTREFPPDRLAARVADPRTGQTIARWAEDESKAQNVLSGITKSDEMPGGRKDSGGSLPRDPRVDWPDIETYLDYFLEGAGREVVWNGRLNEVPKSDGDRMVLTPKAVGHQAALEDRTALQLGFIDGELSKWGDPSTARRLALIEQVIDLVASTSVGFSSADVEAVVAAVINDFTNTEKREGHSAAGEADYYSGGVEIGGVHYDYRQLTEFPEDADWISDLALGKTDTFAEYVLGPDHNRTTALQQQVSAGGAGGYKYARLRDRQNGLTPGPLSDITAWQNIKVLSLLATQNLSLQGAWPNVGYTAKQMLEVAVPEFSYLEVNPEDIDDDGFVIPQAWYSDPGTLADVVKDLTKYGLYYWFVMNGKRFELRQPGTFGREWRANAGPSELKETGEDGSRRWDRIVVAYQDVSGRTVTIGWPGSGADFTSEALQITDPDHPAVKAGIPREDLLTLKGISEFAPALGAAERLLAEVNELSHAGEAVLSGYIQDSAGIFRPVSQVQPGDRIRFDGTGTREIVAVSYDHDSRQATVNLDAPSDAFEALLERYGAALASLQLA